MMISTNLHATESIKPPHPISSFGIATKVLSKLFTNSHYKVIGSCTWAVGKLPPKLVAVPAVEQFLPDLIVTVANRPETNPWIEAKALYENPASQALYQKTYKLATGSELGFGDDAGQTGAMHINEERTRVVDVIGSPAGLYRFPYLSHKSETRFGYPYYLSDNQRSMANSAAIIALPQAHADVVRAGIMLYGVSPFPNQNAAQLGLIPVMRFTSAITAIHHNPPLAPVGYGGTWKCNKPSVIGVVAAGYGDGYPRHISANTPAWVKGREVAVVGRVSMDMLTIDLTDQPDVVVGDAVELWGEHIPVERIAASAGTIAYELLCQITERVRQN